MGLHASPVMPDAYVKIVAFEPDYGICKPNHSQDALIATIKTQYKENLVLEVYCKHVEERAALGIAPKPLDADQTALLVELLKSPPAGKEKTLLDLLENRIPPGVDEAAYVKAGFLSALTKGEAHSPFISKERAVELLGTMQGGYNIEPLILCLDDPLLGAIAAKALSHSLLMFDAFSSIS